MKIYIHQIAYKEGIFQFDSNAYQEGKPIAVGMNPVIKVDTTDSDIVSLQLTVEYGCEGKDVMKYGGVAVYECEDLKGLLSSLEFMAEVWSEAISFFRGILCEKLKGTEIERFLLPNLPEASIPDIPIKQ